MTLPPENISSGNESPPKRTRTAYHSGRRANDDQSPSTCSCCATFTVLSVACGLPGGDAAGLRTLPWPFHIAS